MAEIGTPRQHWSRPWMKAPHAYEMPVEQPVVMMNDGTLVEPFVDGYDDAGHRQSGESGGWFGWLKSKKDKHRWDGEVTHEHHHGYHDHGLSLHASGMAHDGSYDSRQQYLPHQTDARGQFGGPQMYPADGQGYTARGMGWPPTHQQEEPLGGDTEASRCAQSYRYARRHSSDQTQGTSAHRSHYRRHSSSHHHDHRKHGRREHSARQGYHSPPPRYEPTIVTTGARTDRTIREGQEEESGRKGWWGRVFG